MSVSTILLGYLLGSIPFSYLIPWLIAGVDIRKVGTGNVGSHNVMRQVGRGPGALTGGLDLAKGALPVLIARQLNLPDPVALLAGMAAVLGHNYPLFLGFNGGRGLATSLGVLGALMPLEAAAMGALFGGLYLGLTHNIAFSALVSFLPTVPLAWWRGRPLVLVLSPLVLLLLMGQRQFPEIRRMWAQAGDKKALILSKWIFDREARI
jgi:glycerol-3-phosphate acyltransferase PlsY